jgi:branched-chain amino acid transport system ATP-binding protein
VQSLECADRGYVLEQGRTALHGPATELMQDDRLRRAYLGM